MNEIEDEADEQEFREDAKRALNQRWEVDRIDLPNGKFLYRIVSLGTYVEMATVDENENPNAKATADLIVKEHNDRR